MLIGGRGADTFAFGLWLGEDSSGPPITSGADVIRDFEAGRDRLDLTGWQLDGTLLDTDRNGRVAPGDVGVRFVGGDLALDLGTASGRAPAGSASITFSGLGSLSVDDLVPLTPA